MLPIDRLNVVSDRYLILKKASLKNVNLKNQNKVANGLITSSIVFSLKSYFVQENLNKTKQYLSDIGLLYHFTHYPKLKGFASDYDFGFIFCSDNKKAIDACASLKQNRDYYLDGGGLPWYGNAVVNAYLDNWELLEEDCFYIKKSFGQDAYSSVIIQFYQSLIKEDTLTMQSAIESLGSKKYWNATQNKDDLIPQFLLLPALTLAKLAWLKGYKLEFKSEYIPQEWLPVKPLKNYEIPYEFIINHVEKNKLV